MVRPASGLPAPPPSDAQRLQAACLALALLLLYGPTLASLSQTLWRSDDQGHGPIVLGIVVWLLWRSRARWLDAAAAQPRPGLGWPLLALSLAAYALGRSQGIWLFEVGSSVGVLAGGMLVLRGLAALRAIGFALFFLGFLIPLPGALVDALTQPMKLAVSYVAEALLHALRYPVSRSGVILQVGQYQLLVADACAGLHTLFTLEALGLLYLNLVRHAALLRNVALALLIVPISFAANVIRVVVLCLITYHLGDAAGQGFLHGFAGLLLFFSALGLIVACDGALRWLGRRARA